MAGCGDIGIRCAAGALGLAAAFALLFVITPASATDAPLDQAVKATFLYKFAPFVQWPADAFESPQTPLSICVSGDDGVAELIDRAAAGQRDGDRPILVRHLERTENDVPCQILYVAPNQRQPVSQALAAVQDRPVLTVTDSASSPAAHGMIDFVIEGGRVRFDIDERAAAKAGLMNSSRLLSLARTVTPRS